MMCIQSGLQTAYSRTCHVTAIDQLRCSCSRRNNLATLYDHWLPVQAHSRSGVYVFGRKRCDSCSALVKRHEFLAIPYSQLFGELVNVYEKLTIVERTMVTSSRRSHQVRLKVLSRFSEHQHMYKL
jgi:hypothetical protein